MEVPTGHVMGPQPTGLLGVTQDPSVPWVGWRWGFSLWHEGVCGGRTSVLRPDLELNRFPHREALLSHCRNRKNLDSLSVDMRSEDQKYHRP